MLPSFETERLFLRPRIMADLKASLAMDRNAEVTRFIPGPWQEPVQHEAFVRQRIEAKYGNGLGYWSIFAKSDPQRFVGWVLLIPLDAVGPDVEIGWRLQRSSWGRGYATGATVRIVRHAFTTVRLPGIVAEIDADNLASRRVAEKIGMVVAGRTDHGGRSGLRYLMTQSDYLAVTKE
ncbi:GNAT family N-acetyltransferase [Paracoccus sp. S1E-3]|nr:GNAT family N-acetyltransferase [Paracoccus sp. S1E-3]MBA4490434.1 GNAT family N-acetyltransferase [Paracoccus sp. S1E-3]